jgi:cytidyltransferase-like protein
MTGIAFGAFDPLHIGHIFLFINAKSHCDRLIVVAMTDEYILKKKGYKSKFCLNERLEALSHVDLIDWIGAYEGSKKKVS